MRLPLPQPLGLPLQDCPVGKLAHGCCSAVGSMQYSTLLSGAQYPFLLRPYLPGSTPPECRPGCHQHCSTHRWRWGSTCCHTRLQCNIIRGAQQVTRGAPQPGPQPGPGQRPATLQRSLSVLTIRAACRLARIRVESGAGGAADLLVAGDSRVDSACAAAAAYNGDAVSRYGWLVATANQRFVVPCSEHRAPRAACAATHCRWRSTSRWCHRRWNRSRWSRRHSTCCRTWSVWLRGNL